MNKKKPTDIQRMNTLSQTLVQKQKGTLLAPKEVLEKIETLSPKAVATLEDLMENSKADSVKLKAALEILALAGVNKETRISIKTDVTDLDTDEIDSRLSDLLRKAHGVTLEGEMKDITPQEDIDDDEG